MSIYNFRIIIETNDENDVIRDIEIKSTQTFEDFHHIILEAFGFDNSQMASFYVCDEDWNKGQEITLFDMQLPDEEEKKVLTMSETIINTQANFVGQQLIYTYDFLHLWNFFIDLKKITINEEGITYPTSTYTKGEAPNQSTKKIDNIEEYYIKAELMKSENNDNSDDELFSDDIFEGFDDFENYE